jgi:hypothetical protein
MAEKNYKVYFLLVCKYGDHLVTDNLVTKFYFERDAKGWSKKDPQA